MCDINCNHQQTVNIDGINICELCGIQIAEYLLEEQFYVSNKTVARHTLKRDVSRSLYPDLVARGFPQNIIERANHYYTRIIEHSIYRSKNRTSIIFVSTLRAYEDFGDPVNTSELAKRFGLDRKGISKGLLLFGSVFKNELHKNHVHPLDLVPKILSDLGIKDQTRYIHDLHIIYNHAAAKSIDIRKAIPRSIACSIIYYYLKLKNHPISKEDYAKIVGLTDVTFIRIATEFGHILGYPLKEWVN